MRLICSSCHVSIDTDLTKLWGQGSVLQGQAETKEHAPHMNAEASMDASALEAQEDGEANGHSMAVARSEGRRG